MSIEIVALPQNPHIHDHVAKHRPRTARTTTNKVSAKRSTGHAKMAVLVLDAFLKTNFVTSTAAKTPTRPMIATTLLFLEVKEPETPIITTTTKSLLLLLLRTIMTIESSE